MVSVCLKESLCLLEAHKAGITGGKAADDERDSTVGYCSAPVLTAVSALPHMH